MKLLALPFVALLLLLAACSSGDDSEQNPSGNAETPSPLAPTAVPSPTETATADVNETPATNPPDRQPITTTNFETLEAVAETVVESPQFMAWQEDGRLLVASNDAAVLTDPVSGDTQPVYSGAGQERILAISSRGQIATAQPDEMGIDIRALNGEIGARIQLEAQFGAVDFSDDGSLLITTRLEEIAVDVWDARTGEHRQEVTGFETAAPVYSAMLSPDGSKLIWQSRATVQVTDLASGESTPNMEHELFVSALAVDVDSGLLVTTWAAFATLWDLQTGERIQNLDQTVPAFEPAVLPGGDLVLVGSDEGVRAWDPASFQQLGLLDTAARQIAVSPDATLLATIDQGGVVTVWAAGPG